MSFRGLAETGRPPLFIFAPASISVRRDALLFAAIGFPHAESRVDPPVTPLRPDISVISLEGVFGGWHVLHERTVRRVSKTSPRLTSGAGRISIGANRSEERRVGKECRSRW